MHGATVRSRTVYSRHQPGKDLGRTGKCWHTHFQAARDRDCLHLNHYSPSLDYWRRIKLARANGFHKRALSEATWSKQNASFAACEALHSDSELYAKRGTRFYEQLPTRRMSNGEPSTARSRMTTTILSTRMASHEIPCGVPRLLVSHSQLY